MNFYKSLISYLFCTGAYAVQYMTVNVHIHMYLGKTKLANPARPLFQFMAPIKKIITQIR